MAYSLEVCKETVLRRFADVPFGRIIRPEKSGRGIAANSSDEALLRLQPWCYLQGRGV